MTTVWPPCDNGMVALWVRMGYCMHMPGDGRYQIKPMKPALLATLIVVPAWTGAMFIFNPPKAVDWDAAAKTASTHIKKTNESKTTKPVDTREAWIISAEENSLKLRWDCEKAIKQDLKDSRSYKANKVTYWPSMREDPALVMVRVNFNATNSFGASVPGNAACHADKNGNVLSHRLF